MKERLYTVRINEQQRIELLKLTKSSKHHIVHGFHKGLIALGEVPMLSNLPLRCEPIYDLWPGASVAVATC